MKRVPASIQVQLQITCQCFKVMKDCQLLLKFNKERNKIDVMLDN